MSLRVNALCMNEWIYSKREELIGFISNNVQDFQCGFYKCTKFAKHINVICKKHFEYIPRWFLYCEVTLQKYLWNADSKSFWESALYECDYRKFVI